mmetsp:Transcript_26520/g.25381  ORF Transcript_26520/g.25381 Transcript_26520/m.25381 type:complete len:470 (+) Transcript_26520:206-1615(+)
MSQCTAPCCNKPARSQCSVCLKEWYCSSECQGVDWKEHRKICKILKRLSNQLQPYNQVAQIIKEILKAPRNIRVLNYLLKYAEFQFGNRIPSKAYRQRENGERIDNWIVECNIMIPAYNCLMDTYEGDTSISWMDRNNIVLPYNEKILEILKPWSLYLDRDAANRVDSLSRLQIDIILVLSSHAERNQAIIFKQRNQFKISENHCQRALSYARRINEEGESKTTLLLKVLTSCYSIQSSQGNYSGALPFAEEAYNCGAVAYNPVHPKVQEAAGTLIECLSHKGDLYDAERFAQLTLDSLRDPANKVDQESEAVAQGHYNLGRVICSQKGDLVRAEILTKESIRIRTNLFGNNHYKVGNSVNLLADIMTKQGKLGDEVMELYKRSLAIKIKHEGLDGSNTSIGNANLGIYYHQRGAKDSSPGKRKEHFSLAKSCFIEALRINTKIFGPTHLETIEAASTLSQISRLISEA